jgi:hypothetical protein
VRCLAMKQIHTAVIGVKRERPSRCMASGLL